MSVTCESQETFLHDDGCHLLGNSEWCAAVPRCFYWFHVTNIFDSTSSNGHERLKSISFPFSFSLYIIFIFSPPPPSVFFFLLFLSKQISWVWPIFRPCGISPLCVSTVLVSYCQTCQNLLFFRTPRPALFTHRFSSQLSYFLVCLFVYMACWICKVCT